MMGMAGLGRPVHHRNIPAPAALQETPSQPGRTLQFNVNLTAK
jgi:hypothetical protein